MIGWLYLVAGVIGLLYHAGQLTTSNLFPYEVVWVCLVRLLAIVCGVFLLRGSNWARWLALVWMAYHVVLSAFHSLSQLTMHSGLLAVFAYFLFRPQTSMYFRDTSLTRT